MASHSAILSASQSGLKTLLKTLRRIFRLCLSLLALITVCFFVMHVIPGDPFQDEQGVPEEVMETIRHKWGLDKPLWQQYVLHLKQLAHGDLGISMRYPSENISKIILNGFPVSLQLGIQALAIAIPLGTMLGILSARYSQTNIDSIITIGSSLGVSVPSFVVATILQLVFALYFPLFPVARWGTFAHTVLPTISLAIGPTCVISRMMRSSSMDILTREWVVIARMKGLPEWRVLLSHVFPNAVLPIFHYMGPITANLLVGSFVIERVFGIPGLGQWFVNGVMTRDYSVIAGLTLFYSLILFSVHAAIDLLTSSIDQRLTEGERTL
jgi:oligopeptide transport system permease protein